jgi:hypothetical protein
MSPSREFPYQDGDITVLGPETFASDDGAVLSWRGVSYVPQKRFQLAHQARRAKEHQLDGIRRALCDIGVMEDDDPYGHADLEDVIRQALTGRGQDAQPSHDEMTVGALHELASSVRDLTSAIRLETADRAEGVSEDGA